VSGNPLVELVQVSGVSPEDALRLGLTALVALRDLARTDADSAAEHHASLTSADAPDR
jgi:hypothetical protein